MRNFFVYLGLVQCLAVKGQIINLLKDQTVREFNSELSGESAKRNLEYITRLHRMRGSSAFEQAIDFIAEKLKDYHLENIEVIKIPADGKIYYGTQLSRPAWDAEFAELWELDHENKPLTRVADWESMPITLAEDSESGDVTTELIDIGEGTQDINYIGKTISGKLVLTSSSPGSVADLAVGKYKAAGIISYQQNQKTAWSNEDENLIRWGHFETFSSNHSFCFMISLHQARLYKARLQHGEKIMMHAIVKAGKHSGFYHILTATIPGADEKLKNEEITFSCHLDHQRPGANDNASGSVTILEIARTMKKLIDEKRMERPMRTLRFIWSPEIEGTLALLNSTPALTSKIKANIHMDMVGGGQVTKSIFHVAGGPKSLPSFVTGLGEAIGAYVNSETDAFASGYTYQYSFISEEGGKEPLQAVLGQFHMGSDHEVYEEGSFKIPSIYLHDWPDRYIHTNFDVPANIDPTKLKRAGFIGAASGLVVANLTAQSVGAIWEMLRRQSLNRTSQVFGQLSEVPIKEKDNLWRQHINYERKLFESIHQFSAISPTIEEEANKFYTWIEKMNPVKTEPDPSTHVGVIVYKRNTSIKRPMSVFGYDYLSHHLGKEKANNLKLLSFEGIWGHEYAYEALNFVDSFRTVREIRNALSAEFGPVPLEMVEDYLAALESIQIIEKLK